MGTINKPIDVVCDAILHCRNETQTDIEWRNDRLHDPSFQQLAFGFHRLHSYEDLTF